MAPSHSSDDKSNSPGRPGTGSRPARTERGRGPARPARLPDTPTRRGPPPTNLGTLSAEEAYDAAEIPSYCGRGTLIGRSTDDTKIKLIPIFCKRWTCPHCGPLKQARWTKILLAGKPERHITVTCKPYARSTPAEAATALKRAWSRFVDRFRRKGYTCEYAWTLQYHQNGWPHLHILQRGHFIPHRDLSAWMARYMASPIVYLRHIKSATAAVADIIRYVQAPLTKSGDQAPAGARIYRSRGYTFTKDPSPVVDDNTEWIWTYHRDTFHAIMLRYLILYGSEAIDRYPDGSIICHTCVPARNLKSDMDTFAPSRPP